MDDSSVLQQPFFEKKQEKTDKSKENTDYSSLQNQGNRIF